MTRIAESFAKQDRASLIAYITVGDPSPEQTVIFMESLVDAGVDIIELGMPFTDPIADGKVIQGASERALAAGTSTETIFSVVSQFRSRNTSTPLVLMGYLNTIEAMGYEKFVGKAKETGVDGILTVDLPANYAEELHQILRSHDLDMIFLISPTTPEERVAEILAKGSGFIYYVSLKGVTGNDNIDIDEVKLKVNKIKNATKLPVAVGFGISEVSQVARLKDFCDGVVVGSALVKIIEQNATNETSQISSELYKLSKSLVEAL